MQKTLKTNESNVTEKKPINKMSIVSLILGIVSLKLNFLGILSLLTIIFSIISIIQIRKTKERGLPIAIAGLILGVLITTILLIYLIIFSL